MRIIWCIILSLCSTIIFSQKNIKIFAEKENGKTVLYGMNNEVCPLSVLLTLLLNNMTAVEADDKVYVIPPGPSKNKLVELNRIKKGKAVTYSYTYNAVFGNVKQFTYDADYLYDLPYSKGLQVRVEQGYNGSFTHQNVNALDFKMGEGTPILAAREGVVAAVVQEHYETCLREECKQMANYVLIAHSDGTFAEYAHIQYNGARVAVGDTVMKGDTIALSGSTGYAKGPHLHFVCFLPGITERNTLTTKFRTGKGKTSAYLLENRSYKRNY